MHETMTRKKLYSINQEDQQLDINHAMLFVVFINQPTSFLLFIISFFVCLCVTHEIIS
jgi:hypothetical protein